MLPHLIDKGRGNLLLVHKSALSEPTNITIMQRLTDSAITTNERQKEQSTYPRQQEGRGNYTIVGGRPGIMEQREGKLKLASL